MGIPGSPYSGDPVVIIGIPFSRRLAVRCGSTLTVRVQFSRRVKRKMSKYKVAKSGGESISLYEIENGRSREKSRAATWGVRHRRRFSFNVYNYSAVDVSLVFVHSYNIHNIYLLIYESNLLYMLCILYMYLYCFITLIHVVIILI